MQQRKKWGILFIFDLVSKKHFLYETNIKLQLDFKENYNNDVLTKTFIKLTGLYVYMYFCGIAISPFHELIFFSHSLCNVRISADGEIRCHRIYLWCQSIRSAHGLRTRFRHFVWSAITNTSQQTKETKAFLTDKHPKNLVPTKMWTSELIFRSQVGEFYFSSIYRGIRIFAPCSILFFFSNIHFTSINTRSILFSDTFAFYLVNRFNFILFVSNFNADKFISDISAYLLHF